MMQCMAYCPDIDPEACKDCMNNPDSPYRFKARLFSSKKVVANTPIADNAWVTGLALLGVCGMLLMVFIRVRASQSAATHAGDIEMTPEEGNAEDSEEKLLG